MHGKVLDIVQTNGKHTCKKIVWSLADCAVNKKNTVMCLRSFKFNVEIIVLKRMYFLMYENELYFKAMDMAVESQRQLILLQMH
jgi:hypothetical protein